MQVGIDAATDLQVLGVPLVVHFVGVCEVGDDCTAFPEVVAAVSYGRN